MNINSGGLSSSLTQSTQNLNRTTERISSGKQINGAGDNAAGLAISNRLGAQINEYTQATRNANDGVSLLQAKSANLNSLTDGIQRIRELALQASNGTLTDTDRSAINNEAQQILSEVSRTIEDTNFNGNPLLSGDSNVNIQLGSEDDDSINIHTNDFTQLLSDLNFGNIDLSTAEGSQSSLNILDEIQININTDASEVGAGLNRLNSAINTLTDSEINAEASRSNILDADIAKEVSELTANNIKLNAALALQAQANQRSGAVLKLLEDL